ncbi:MAG: DUF2125 domain-containing protein [Yoonia sp.]|nr:DUF2125 domain-containing protein [Yoonia sp.]
MRGAVCIAAIFAGGAAQAEVTAAQVWEDWKAQFALYGDDSVSIGSEETTATTVAVRDIVLRMDDDLTEVRVFLGDVLFSERGDGTVSIAMAESYPITMTDDDGVIVTLLVSQSGLDLIVSGDTDDLRYAISADRYEIALGDVVNGDVTFTGDASATAHDISGIYTSRTGDLRDLSYALNVASVDLLVDIALPEDDGGVITANGKISDITAQADMTMPLDPDFENPDVMIASGFSIDGGYSVASSAYVFDIEAEGGRVAGAVNTGAGRLNFRLNGDNLAYDAQTTDIAVNVLVPNFPVPIELQLAKYGLGFSMPLSRADEPADFGLNFDLADLTVNDVVWDMFDPAGVLARDPATIALDVSGTATPMVNLMNPEQDMDLDSAEMPVALNTLVVNRLRLALAGALLTGTGNFTFDNSDLETFDGMPRPEGSALIEVTGLNRLMDNLVAMGLIPQDQIMAGRMMLGMFARVTGDDQLETRVEVNAQGHVIVNGQRLR